MSFDGKRDPRNFWKLNRVGFREPVLSTPTESELNRVDDESRIGSSVAPIREGQFQYAGSSTDGQPEHTGLDGDFDSLSRYRNDRTLLEYLSPGLFR